ncbi:MAG TPA: glycosyltransferase family 1 protein [Acidimicrobiia bacterium]|nr:glycosyltransferase family 1 protein [Acidimicrobiia bacterium]
MRVALNLEQLLQPAPGGIGRYTAELARLLPALPAGDGDEITLVPFVARHSREDVETRLREFGLGGVDPVVLPLPRPLLYDAWHLLRQPGLGRSRRLRNTDVVHAPSVAVPPKSDVPLVVTAHDAAPLIYPETYPRRGRRFHAQGLAAAAKRADLVITVSQSAAEELAAYTAIPTERIRVVPNGVDLEIATDAQVAATRREFELDDAPYVFWVGSLEPRKNVELLVDAFVRWALHTDLPHLLVLAGPAGWLEDETSVLAPARRLGNRVRTLGRVGDPALGALYRGADLFAFPSRHEGFGIPVLEAMAQETPVLAADIPALREIAAGAAVLRSPDDTDAWVAALDNLLHDEAELSRWGSLGRGRAQGYSWTRCAEETRAIYLEAVGA